MKRLLAVTAIIACFGWSADSAEAGGVQFYSGSGCGQFGYRAPSLGHYGGNFRHYGYRHGGRTWHDTSHYDYHPGEYLRHRNHYHYVPGHYDFHQTGHWDRIGRGHHGYHR